jgi:hypothetical protein
MTSTTSEFVEGFGCRPPVRSRALESGRLSGHCELRVRPGGRHRVAFDPDRTSRCFSLGAKIKNYDEAILPENWCF